MIEIDFDRPINRTHGDSEKWNEYGPGVLPMWVADMDFKSPEPVIRALEERVAHGVFGYGSPPHDLQEIIADRMKRLYAWEVAPEAIVLLPGVITGFNIACRAFTRPGDGLFIQTPVYPPILHVHENHQLVSQQNELVREPNGTYSIDLDAFEDGIQPNTRMFLLCNPHNPVGRAFRRDELEEMARISLRHDLVICSDEIHSDLVFSGHRHTPIASLDPEIARATITLMAPSKTFNIAGLDCSYAIIPDEDLRRRFQATRRGIAGDVNILGLAAARAAYLEGEAWLSSLISYLEGNRDTLVSTLRSELPDIQVCPPDATYLAWLDCRELGLDRPACEFFLKEAKVAVNDGASFGKSGAGFVRFNFGCPRDQVNLALQKMKQAVEEARSGGQNAKPPAGGLAG